MKRNFLRGDYELTNNPWISLINHVVTAGIAFAGFVAGASIPMGLAAIAEYRLGPPDSIFTFE